VSSEPFDPRFGAALREFLRGPAHLRNALGLHIIDSTQGDRHTRFCLWRSGWPSLTLAKIEHNPRFTAGGPGQGTQHRGRHDQGPDEVRRTQQLDAAGPVCGGARGCRSARLSELAAARTRARFSLQDAPVANPNSRSQPEFTSAGASYGNSGREAASHASRVLGPAPLSDARGEVCRTRCGGVTDFASGSGNRGCPKRAGARQEGRRIWLFELEADCHHPGRVTHMMHFLDRESTLRWRRSSVAISPPSAPRKRARRLASLFRAVFPYQLLGQGLLCVEASRETAPTRRHMVRARRAILQRGVRPRQCVHRGSPLRCSPNCRGAACLTFHSRNHCCCRRWFPISISTRSPIASRTRSWFRCSFGAPASGRQESAQGTHSQLFTTPPEKERDLFSRARDSCQGVPGADRLGRMIEPLIPARMRGIATRLQRTRRWSGSTARRACGAIFPAMRQCLGSDGDTGLWPRMTRRRVTAENARCKKAPSSKAHRAPLLASPVSHRFWDTALASLADARNGDATIVRRSIRALDWLKDTSAPRRTENWQVNRPGGWPAAVGRFSSRIAYPDRR